MGEGGEGKEEVECGEEWGSGISLLFVEDVGYLGEKTLVGKLMGHLKLEQLGTWIQ